MEILNISRRKFNSLQPLELSNEIFNTEAQMFLLEQKSRWRQQNLILKRFYQTFGEKFSNKLYTINELLDKKDAIGIEELVMPKSLVAVGGEAVGFTMDYIPNINFQEVLDSSQFSHEEKVAYLKEIGMILEKLKISRKYSGVTDFYLNDIHENNFILNTETGKINVVDLDSAKIGNNLPSASRYLSPFSQLVNVSKYEISQSSPSIGGYFTVNENTDIYCYIVMIFKYFYGDNIGKMSIGDFYVYLEYLSKLGVSKEFLDVISYIYTNRSNENPYELLDALTPFYGRTHQNTYNLVRKRIFK